MPSPILSENGLVQRRSNASFADTVQRVRDAIAQRGLKLFAVIDHSGEAASVGFSLTPTQVIVFGSPEAGTPLMMAKPLLAIDLPLRILVVENAAGVVSVVYTAPEYLIARHGLDGDAAKVLGGAAKLAEEAAG